MRAKHWLQFRLATLLLAITLLAIGLSVWTWFISPNITGFSIRNGELVLLLSDEFARKLFPELPYYDAEPRLADPYSHNAYVVLPLYVVAIVFALLIAVVVCIFVVVNLLLRYSKRRHLRHSVKEA